MANKDCIYKRNEAGKNFVPTVLIPVLFGMIIAIFVLLCFAGFCVYKQNYVQAGIAFGVALVFAIFGRYCDGLEWHRNVAYKFNDDYTFEYSYDLDSNILPVAKPRVTLKVTRVDSFICHDDKIDLKGMIHKRAPMSKPRDLKKIVMCDIPEHHDEIVQKLRNAFEFLE